MLCYHLWMDFQGKIILKWLQKIWKKPSSLLHGGHSYKVMPFGLKYVGATYQCAVTTLLHDLIHKKVEVYVDDMIMKSEYREGHIPALQKFFERI